VSLTPEELYARLSGLIAEMPDLNNPTSPETQRWLGRASALVQATGDPSNAATDLSPFFHPSMSRVPG